MSADETDAKFHPLETDLQSDTAAATSTAAASRSPSSREAHRDALGYGKSAFSKRRRSTGYK